MSEKFIVKVDDNFHFGDESERYSAGEYDTLAEAIERCRQIVLDDLKGYAKPGLTAQQLHEGWLGFGDDPFIVGPVEGVPFSAREFVTDELCRKVIEEIGG